MRKDVLQRVCELESIDIVNTELNVSINDKLRRTQDFSTQVTSVSKARLLALPHSERLHRLQVHVVVK